MRKTNGTTNNGAKGSTNNGASGNVRDFSVLKSHVWDGGGVTADITINGVTIYGVRVVESRNGDFLSLPKRKGSNGTYYHIVYIKMSDEEQAAIIAEIERQINGE